MDGEVMERNWRGVVAWLLAIGCALAATAPLPAWETGRRICSATEFGATGNGKDYDTDAIQSCIDYCADQGGGVVHISPGAYLTGTLFLRARITLWVAEGATILGSTRQADFPHDPARWYTILAEDAHDVELTGGGTISGQGLQFVAHPHPEKNVMVSWNTTGPCRGDECRPRLVGLKNSTHVRVWNLRLVEPAYWCLHVVSSDSVHIHDVSIRGDFNSPNTDGIDVDSSNNTVIERCVIETGDDAVCVKSAVGPMYNLTVRGCWIRTKSCAVKVGSGTEFDVAGLLFERIVVVESHRGLGIQLRDEGNVSNVTYAHIQMSTRYYHPSWWGRAEPIYITACPRAPGTTVGSITNIHFLNITATSENGIFLSGVQESQLKGLHFRDVDVRLERWTNFTSGLHDYRPGCQGLVAHRMSGLFMEHLGDVWMQNVAVRWKASDVGDWGLPFYITPFTVRDMRLVDYENTYLA